MSLIENIKKKFFPPPPESSAARRISAKKLDGSHIRYAVERKNNVEEVVMRDGHLNISPDGKELLLVSGIKTVFRAEIDCLSQGELLSHDGVILSGIDLESGEERQLVAYFKYYR